MSDTSAAKPKRNVRRIVVRTVLLLVGVGLLALFVRAAGLDEILANLRRIGWGFLWLLGISSVWRTFAVGGMWTLLDTEHRIPFLKLTAIRSAGESVNTLMPFGNVGGEPIKIMMLAREIGGTAATKYVVLDKTVFFLSGIAFMTSGTVVGAVLLADHLEVLLLTIAMLIPWTAVLAWIVWRQVKGDFVVKASRALRLLRIPLSDKTLGKLARIDGAVTEFWRPENRKRFAVSFVLHFIGRALRAADVWLCVWLLGESISWTGAYFSAAAGMLVSATFFFIPGALGASEGGHAFVFDLIGLGVSAGVTVGLVRRIRNYALSILGYGLVVAWPTDKKPVAADAKLEPQVAPPSDAP